MIIPKEKFLDRFKQTFQILKKDFKYLFIPFFIYNFISIVIIGTINRYYFLSFISKIQSENIVNYFGIFSNPMVLIIIIVGVILFIGYLILFIPIFLGLIKTIKQSLNEESITLKENLMYGFKNIFKSFKSYWYIFAYVALIPALIFIVGGIIIILFNSGIMRIIGSLLVFIAFITFMVFAIYRGLKAIFVLYSATDNNSFTKDDFNKSLLLTKDNWWRILGNLFLMGLIITIIVWIISGIINTIIFVSTGGVGDLSKINYSSQNPEVIIEQFKLAFANYSVIISILKNTIGTVFETLASVFGIIFIYIFYKRLKDEKNLNNLNEEVIEKENIINQINEL